MSLGLWGALLGLTTGLGVLLVVEWVLLGRRTSFEQRVVPYLRDLPQNSRIVVADSPQSAASAIFGPFLRGAADLVERVLGGATSVRRRLERADVEMGVRDFRIAQVTWGLVAFAVVAVPGAVVSVRSPQRAVPLLICSLTAFAFGVLLRENRLTAQAERREQEMLAEFPALSELLALAVTAGESPVAALDRVVGRSTGELSNELRRVLAQVRTGMPMTEALDQLAARTGLPIVARFAEGMAVAIERGTPLADVLHAQAGDVREAGRRGLIENGARREVLMMLPVVFLVLPTVVVFAFWPGLIGLQLVVP